MKKLVRRVVMLPFVNLVIRRIIRSFARGSRSIADSMIRYVHVSGVVDIEIQRQRIKLYAAGDDALTSKLYYNDWEREVTFWFSNFCTRYSSIIDAGANIGVYSLLAGKANANALVHSFEPNPYNFVRLENNVALNRLTGRIFSHRLALGHNLDEISFYIPADKRISDMSSMYRTHAGFCKDFDYRKIYVPVITLDEFCDRHRVLPQLIKIDVELYELQVLQGMQSILRNARPFVFCEIFNDEVRRRINPPLDSELQPGYTQALEDYLRSIDYSIYAIGYDGILYVDSLRSSHASTMYLLLPVKLKEPFYISRMVHTVLDELACG